MSELNYVIIKRGVYYAPDKCGYTGVLDSAGRYSKEEADSACENRDDVTMMLAIDASRFSPNCYKDIKEKILAKESAAKEYTPPEGMALVPMRPLHYLNDELNFLFKAIKNGTASGHAVGSAGRKAVETLKAILEDAKGAA